MKEKTYKFRRKTFAADPRTIQELNYALALNRSDERYVEVPTAVSKEKK